MRYLFALSVLVELLGSAFGQPPQCPPPPQAPPVIGRHHCPCTSPADCTCTNCTCANCEAKPAPKSPPAAVRPVPPPVTYYARPVYYYPAPQPVYWQPAYRFAQPTFGGFRGGPVCVGGS